MNWKRFTVQGILAVLAGVITAVGTRAFFPDLPSWALAIIGGAVTGLCMPIAVSRSRETQGPEKSPPTDQAHGNQED